MPDFYIDELSIDPYEYIRECSKSEIRDLIIELVDEGHLAPSALSQIRLKDDGKPMRTTPLQDEFVDKMASLIEKYNILSKEDEEILQGLFKKYL